MKAAAKIYKGKIYHNNGTNKSCGIATLINTNIIEKSNLIYSDNKGRILIIDITVNNSTFRIINIYANNCEKERKEMFYKLGRWINNRTIIIGDFNTVLSKSDISINNVYKNDISRTTLYDLMSNYNLSDVWRIQNQFKREFSRRQVVQGKLRQSRIDLCLAAAEMVKEIGKVTYTFNTWSDHATLVCQLGIVGEVRGGGTWCLNASLLDDPAYVKKIKNLLNYARTEMQLDNNHIEKWDNIKERIKRASINFSKQKRWKEKQEEQNIRKKLEEELILLDHQRNRDCGKYELYKNQLINIEKKKCRGAAIRCRFQNLVEGEKCTAFFLGLEKQKQNKTIITELKDKDNNIHKDKIKILEIVTEYYQDLFKEEGSDERKTEEIISYIDRKISKDDKSWCDSKLTLKEIENTIKNLNKNKSPGSDGLTADFYMAFSEQMAPLLLDLYQAIQDNKQTPQSLSKGIITLIYKNKGDRNNISNYRPISLLNTDYKILTKTLANRLKLTISQVISTNQAYSIPNRDIQDTILTIRDTIRGMKVQGGHLLTIDLEKAFDRVEHDFLFKVLGKMGYGEGFIEWVKLLYRDARSVIKCNGFLTDSFRIGRSVRQGCPLSALLYSIATEPLAQAILQDKHILGIHTPANRTVKITQYADDITITVKSGECIDRILEHFKTYSAASGAKINTHKSEIGTLGRDHNIVNKWGFCVNNGSRKILGVYIGGHEGEDRDRGWREVLGKIQNVLNLWKSRGLTLKGKVIVVNVLILSKINHILGTCELPQWALNSLKAAISSFLWRGKGNLIAHRVLISNKREGGLGLIDISAKKDALRVKIVKNFLDPERQYPWEDWMASYLAEYGERDAYNLCALLPGKARSSLPDFYQEVLEAWGKILPHLWPKCSNKEHVLQLPFLDSPFFLCRGRVLISGPMRAAGLTRVGDVVDESGLFNVNLVCEKLKTKKVNYRKDNIRKLNENFEQALDPMWRGLLKRQERGKGAALPQLQLKLKDNVKDLKELKTRTWYRMLIQHIQRPPTAEKHWKTFYPDMDIASIWTFLDTPLMDSKTICMDFNIRHRRIRTGIILHQINKDKYSRTCTVCNQEPEDLDHLLFECTHSIPLQNLVKTILQTHCNYTPHRSIDWIWNWTFGLTKKHVKQNITLINTIFTIARKALWMRRNFALHDNKTINVIHFFRNSVLLHLKTIFAADPDTFNKHFSGNNSLIRITENNKISINI